MIGTSNQSCWLAEACKILLRRIMTTPVWCPCLKSMFISMFSVTLNINVCKCLSKVTCYLPMQQFRVMLTADRHLCDGSKANSLSKLLAATASDGL